ncbi:MAG: SelL-related redox protein [Planctomycetota bacterium]|nr:SelL-related redox protein [Planctomycetota bacterium]
MTQRRATSLAGLSRPAQPTWIRGWLLAAAVYNVAWGAWAVLFPGAFWRLVGMEQPNYPFLWQCIGMIVGVYGVGYAIASRDIARHWPIVLVGLLGKVFGPIGFVWACWVEKQVPPHFGLTILTNDLLWWPAFALSLRYAWLANERERRWIEDAPLDVIDAHVLEQARDQRGTSLGSLSEGAGVLVVLLRHAGCTFCREALADLARDRAEIERSGTRIVLVTQSSEAKAAAEATRYGLVDVSRISDPDRNLYRAFGLRRGTLGELFGARVWVRGFSAGILARHGVGGLDGDGFQMPGAFVLKDRRVIRAYRHRDAADRPEYCELVSPAESERVASLG